MIENEISEGYDWEPERSGGTDFVRLAKKGDKVKLRFVSLPVHYFKKFESRDTPGEVEEKIRHMWRVIDRTDGSIKLFEQGNQVYLQLRQYREDPEWGEPSHEKTGFDVTIERTEKSPSEFYAITLGRAASPLSTEEKEAVALHELTHVLKDIAAKSASRDPYMSGEATPAPTAA